MKAKATKPVVKRPPQHKGLKVLQQVEAHHEIISEYVTIALQSQALFETPHPIKKIKGMQAFLTDRVIKHFAFEEESVYPKLQTSPSLVNRLKGEHQTMQSQVKSLQKKLNKMTASSSTKAWKELQASFGDLLRMLLAHTIREDVIYQKQQAA